MHTSESIAWWSGSWAGIPWRFARCTAAPSLKAQKWQRHVLRALNRTRCRRCSKCMAFLVTHRIISICRPIGGLLTLSSNTYCTSPLFQTLSTGLWTGFWTGGRCIRCTYSVLSGLLLADRLKLSNERLERTYTYHTSLPCLKPSALGRRQPEEWLGHHHA